MTSVTETKNPDVIKFNFKENYFPEAKEYSEISQTEDFPLAKQLLQFPFIVAVLTSGNFIAVQKIPEINWDDVQAELQEVIDSGMKDIETKKNTKLPIEVYIEATPNPDTIKLVTNALLFEGIAESTREKPVNDFPLADEMFKMPFIEGVFVQDNYISLTKKKEADWQNYNFEIRDVVSNYLREGKPIVLEGCQSENVENRDIPKKEFSETEKEIQNILEEYVKPAVAGDGGNIDLVEYDEATKTAKMLLQGACSGCPSSTITLKNGIETILKKMLPGKIDEVIAINA